jgi:hypothetical protein
MFQLSYVPRLRKIYLKYDEGTLEIQEEGNGKTHFQFALNVSKNMHKKLHIAG